MSQIKKHIGLFYELAIPVVLFFLFAFLAPGFGVNSIRVLISQSLFTFVMSLGLSFVMMTGLFDLSFGTQLLLVTIFSARLAQLAGTAGMLLGALLGGILLSMCVGFLYVTLKIPSMVLSLSMVMILEYLGRVLAGTQGAINIGADVTAWGKAPYSYLYTVVAVVIYCILVYYTKTGKHLNLVGDNELIALQIGVNVRKTKFLAFSLCGVFCGIGAIMNLCYSGVAAASVGMASLSSVFRPMMAVMIAMALMNLYQNIVINLYVSMLSVIIIFNGVIALGIPSSMEDVILGSFLLIIMTITGNVSRWAELLRRRSARRALAAEKGGPAPTR